MFSIEEILKATDAILLGGSLQKRVSGVSLDSRTIKPGELFIAIRGRRFNGHSFITQARSKGAGAVLFSDARYLARSFTRKYQQGFPALMVKDTLRALGMLAHYYRSKFKIPVIAITGSNGKTTTKEMLKTILGLRFEVLHNPGTENNYIGTPLAIFRLRKGHNLAVLELGANHPGEIDWLSWVVQPTTGIITNIGPSHFEFFKSLQGVFRAKIELIKNLAKQGTLIINRDDQFLSQLKGTDLRTITFGMNRSADFSGKTLEQTEKGTTFLLNKRHRITVRSLGRHNVYNALAAIACARRFAVGFNEIKNALAHFQTPAMRMQLLKLKNITIINDCYNANPESFRCALDSLQGYPNHARKIVVCGDMLELGPAAEKLHVNLGQRIANSKIDFLIAVGPLAKRVACAAHYKGMSEKKICTCRSASAAARALRKIVQPEDIVLIKGSRAMKMENVVKCFTTSSIH